MIQNVQGMLAHLLGDKRGVTALEYGVIAAATVVAIITIMSGIGTSLTTIFTTISTNLATAAG